jgi:hypothetical protein
MKACDLDFLLFYDFPHILSQPNVALGLFFFFFAYCVYQALCSLKHGQMYGYLSQVLIHFQR